MLQERLLGVVFLGAATLAATWGGNGVLHAAANLAEQGPPPAAVHAGALDPAAPDPAAGGDLPVAESSTTATTAAPASTSSTQPATAPTAPGGEPAAEVLKRALLTQADVPPGFVLTSPAPSDGGNSADSPFERCAGPDAASLVTAIQARGRSATFAKADVGSVSSLAVVLDQPGTAQRLLGQLTGPTARSCFEGLINTRLARNPKLSQDVKGALGPTPAPTLGDASLGYRFEVRLPAEDVDAQARPDDPPVRFIADFVMILKGRALVLLEFDNLRQPWAEPLLRSVATNVAGRL